MTIFWAAVQRLRDDQGLSLASGVAFSFVLSLFPFFVFTASFATIWGGPELVINSLTQFFAILPDAVANALVPELEKALRASRLDILTLGGFLTLLFAGSALQSLRGALNNAYDVQEDRSFIQLQFQNILMIIQCAIGAILLGSSFVFAPEIAEVLIKLFNLPIANSVMVEAIGYSLALIIVTVQLFIFHTWLPAGKHRFLDLVPGVLISIILFIIFGFLFSIYVKFAGYDQLYAGLSQFVMALIFFQFSALLVIFGAEYNYARMLSRAHLAFQPV